MRVHSLVSEALRQARLGTDQRVHIDHLQAAQARRQDALRHGTAPTATSCCSHREATRVNSGRSRPPAAAASATRRSHSPAPVRYSVHGDTERAMTSCRHTMSGESAAIRSACAAWRRSRPATFQHTRVASGTTRIEDHDGRHTTGVTERTVPKAHRADRRGESDARATTIAQSPIRACTRSPPGSPTDDLGSRPLRSEIAFLPRCFERPGQDRRSPQRVTPTNAAVSLPDP